MAALTTRETFRDKTALLKRKVWSSLTIANGDTLATKFKDVFAVHVSKPNLLTGWTVSAGVITFTTSGSIAGPVIVEGRG